MKRTILALLLAVATMSVISCKKKDTPPPVYPIQGLWIGKYGSGTATPNNGYSMVVESSGNVTVADGDNISTSPKATGTWTLTGSTFKATYTYSGGGSTFSMQATWTNDGKMASGTWGPGTTPTGGGTWYMNRVN